MESFLITAQIVVSVLLIVTILSQQRGSALGSSFGQEGGGYYSTRRGLQKRIFQATIVLAVLFILLSFLNLLF